MCFLCKWGKCCKFSCNVRPLTEQTDEELLCGNIKDNTND